VGNVIKPTKQENLNERIKNSIIINNISNERCVGSGLSEDDASVTATTAVFKAVAKHVTTARVAEIATAAVRKMSRAEIAAILAGAAASATASE
jgi:hypothetical protein